MKTLQTLSMSNNATDVLALLESGPPVLFLTGRAGTGKSSILQQFRQKTSQHVVILAPTGAAAVVVQGQTIHSFFRFKLGVTPDAVRDMRVADPELYKNLDVLAFDEASMIRADLLDCVDQFLRLYGPHKGIPFGGIRTVLIGDLLQLPPVVTKGEAALFASRYASPYFFDADVFDDVSLSIIELTRIWRQTDPDYLQVLEEVRTGSLSAETVAYINKRCVAPARQADTRGRAISLVTTNAMADEINDACLASLDGRPTIFRGALSGTFARAQLPTAAELTLKPGARVMLMNNDGAGRWVNGTLGRVIRIDPKRADAAVTVQLDGGARHVVEPFSWETMRYVYDDARGELTANVAGRFRQYPLRLAWSVTIHKAQGKTFKRVSIDFGRGAFAHGQTYVALSRCTSLEGLVLHTPLERRHVIIDPRVRDFVAASLPTTSFVSS